MRATLHDLPRVLAELHRKLHQIDSEPMRAALEALSPGSNSHTPAGKLQRAIDLVSPNGIEARRAGELLQTQQPQVSHPVICHGDFHPLNVMVDQGNVTGVLDWGRI